MKFAFALLLGILSACSGGDGSSGHELSNDSCSILGLGTQASKVLNGSACSQLDQAPVTRVAVYDAKPKLLALCTGSLISPTQVLTAAHCIQQNTRSVAVIFGDAAAPTTVFAHTVRVHPGFVPLSAQNRSASFNDVAVIELREEVSITPLPILTSRQIEAGEDISIFGFGQSKTETFDFEDLRSGEMRIDAVSENHIVAKFNGEGSNTCQGDSGGPAIIASADGAPALVGVTSSGAREDCGKGDTSLFVNLQNPVVLDFIKAVVPQLATN